MPLSKERKEELVAEYTEMLEQSNAIILTEYRGLGNQEMIQLRRAVREAGGIYRVTKLTLLKRALEASGYTIPDDLVGTPIALGFCLDEVPGVAKALSDYAEDSDFMVIRGGLMRDRFLSAQEIEALADLPPVDVLLAQILGLFDAPAANLVGVVQSGVAQVVNVLKTYADQAEGVPVE